ncbi:unnamed protein product [Pieris brassicae]|uniref:Uncharacterized protein n=1 Tax=Pieris brassicae TaxID=7116 RepID=A0A9P0SWL6_PIEBR|nr:unnamed protein product [Pieris brassicae]
MAAVKTSEVCVTFGRGEEGTGPRPMAAASRSPANSALSFMDVVFPWRAFSRFLRETVLCAFKDGSPENRNDRLRLQAQVVDRPLTEISQYLACLNPEREFVPGFNLNIVRFMPVYALLGRRARAACNFAVLVALRRTPDKDGDAINTISSKFKCEVSK